MALEASSIDEVITTMDDIIQDAINTDSRLGYFASLYRLVTVVVRNKCNEGFFEDNERSIANVYKKWRL